MVDHRPLVSIGMPVYNEERYISQALDSLLAQKYTNFELIVSDNASEDSTQKICLEYAARDRRIRYYRNKSNVGTNKNFSRVLELSRGEYFMWAGGHDVWAPEFISRCVNVLQQDCNAILVYPQSVYIDSNGEELPWSQRFLFDTRFTRGKLARFNMVIWGCPSAYLIHGLIRSSVLRNCLPLRKTCNADLVLLGELSFHGTFAQIPEVLFYTRHTLGEQTMDEILERHSKNLFTSHRRILLPFWRDALEFVLVPLRIKGIGWKARVAALWSIVPFCIAMLGPEMISDLKRLLKRRKWRWSGISS